MTVPHRRGPRRVAVAVGTVGVAVAVVLAVCLIAGGWPYRVLGNADPGAVVRLATPLLRLACWGCATVCLGALVFAAAFTRPEPGGGIAPRGWLALRTAGRWAVGWCAAALGSVVLEAADTAGLPLRRVGSVRGMVALVHALEAPKAWLVTAGAVLVVAVGCRLALRWWTAALLLVVAVLAVVPPLVTEHSSSDAGHDLAGTAIVLHVPAALVWLGTLLALARPSWRSRPPAELTARRYRRLALGCWLTLAGTGVLDAAVLAPGHTLVTSGYGALVLVKAVLFATLGAVGVIARRRLTGGTVRRLVTAELVLLSATAGVSVGLTHLPRPAFLGRAVTGEVTLLGYTLAGPPTPARLVLDWRVDVLLGPLAVLLATGYLLGVRRLRRSGRAWPAGRTAAWLAGCGVLLVASSTGIGRYAPAMFSVHLAAHMLIGMLVPVLWALGGPGTLAAAALRPAAARGPVGPREWLAAVRDSPPVRLLTTPPVAVLLFTGAPFLLYFTGLYDAVVRFHWAHQAVNVCFLGIGYVFAWATVGVDPTPRPLPNLVRLGMLLAAMPFDIVFGAAVIGSRRLIGNGPAGSEMYTALALPWVPDLHADQRLAGALALAVAELSLLVGVAVLAARWNRGDDEPDGAAHRELLAALRARSPGPGGTGEGAQPEAVGHHQQRGQGHGGAGDEGIEQAGGGER